jgi:serine/threonine protein kinase
METNNRISKKMGIERIDYTGYIQKNRNKKNISYTLRDGREIFAKFAKNENDQNEGILEGMRREAEILRKLEDTGITPKVIQIKEYPNKKMTRLVTEKISGTSIDRLEIKKNQESEIIGNIIVSTAESLQKIHEQGIYVIDVNIGTFLVNEQGKDAKLVDFEHAIDSSNSSEKEVNEAIKFRYSGIGDVIGFDTPEGVTGLRKKEMYTWAKTMLNLIEEKTGSQDILRMDFNIQELTEDDRTKYEEYLNLIEEKIRNYAKKMIDKAIAGKSKEQLSAWINPNKDTSKSFDEFLEEFKKTEIERAVKNYLNTALIKITLKYKLKNLGIELPEKTLQFLQKCLNSDYNNRPDSFSELLQ